jgi:co-chaperonin GroES (HSP10)
MLQPKSDWILARFDPLKKRSSVIDLVTQSESAVRTGTVLIPGPGRYVEDEDRRMPMDVKEGDRIAFLRWHQEHRPGKANSEVLAKMSAELGGDLVLIRQNDILFVFDGDVEVDVP